MIKEGLDCWSSPCRVCAGPLFDPAVYLRQRAASVLLSVDDCNTRTRAFLQISSFYKGGSSTPLLRSRNLCASVSSKTMVPATVSHSKSALVCSIIGWGFRWKGTAGEKAFLEGKWFSSEEEKLFSADHNGRLGQGRSPIVINPFNGAFT